LAVAWRRECVSSGGCGCEAAAGGARERVAAGGGAAVRGVAAARCVRGACAEVRSGAVREIGCLVALFCTARTAAGGAAAGKRQTDRRDAARRAGRAR